MKPGSEDFTEFIITAIAFAAVYVYFVFNY